MGNNFKENDMQTQFNVFARNTEQQIRHNESIVKALNQLNTTVTKRIIEINNETLELKAQRYRSNRHLGALSRV